MSLKFCKDCSWFRQGLPAENSLQKPLAVCYHPKSLLSVDLVYGDKTYSDCKLGRRLWCGESAELFEPKFSKQKS